MEEWEEQCQVTIDILLELYMSDAPSTDCLCVQVVLRASAGIDYWEFTQLLCLVALSRLNHLQTMLPSGPHHSHLQAMLLSPIHTLIHETLSHSSKTVTFLKTVSDFETAMIQDGMDTVLCSLKDLDGDEAKRKLLKLLPPSLVSHASDMFNVSVLFRLYELTTIQTLIQNVVSLLN